VAPQPVFFGFDKCGAHGLACKPILGTKPPKLGMMRRMATKRTARKAATRTAPRVSLADALFSGTRQRVLGLLFGQPDRSFYANELIALIRGGSGAVQREIARLTQSGLVTVRVSGNQKHFQANRESPIFEELCGIARKTVALVEPLQQALAPLARGIRAAFIYGSVAKRQDTASSDVDLMVVSDKVTYTDLYGALEPVSQHLVRTVNPTIYTTKELAQRIESGESFIKRVMGQPKIWLIGSEDALGL
jgi:predicted nucleotidyltransferase